MEKEITATYDYCDINFTFDDELWLDDLSPVQNHMTSLARVLGDFLNKHLKVVDKSILNLSLNNINKMKAINLEHRGIDKETDVLSFPLQEDIRNSDFEVFHSELELGDILICSEVCVKQAEKFQLSFAEEFYHLVIHGFLHLCGYDHEISEEEEKIMEQLEEKLLKDFSGLKNKKA